MSNKILGSLLFLVIFLSSCNSSQKNKYDAMAEELCTCMEPLLQINDRIQTLVAAEDTEGLGTIYLQFEKELETVEMCALKVEQKYGEMNDQEEEAQAQAALKRKCPKVSELINQEGDLE